MLNGLFNRSKQNPEREQDQTEYIQYAQEVESTLRLKEAQLHESDDADEIIQMVLKTACNFFRGIGWVSLRLTLKWIYGRRMCGTIRMETTKRRYS